MKNLAQIDYDPGTPDPYLRKQADRKLAPEQLRRWQWYPWRESRFKFADDVSEETAEKMAKKARQKYRKSYMVEREKDGLYCYSMPMKQRYMWDLLEVGEFFVLGCGKSAAYRLMKKAGHHLNRNFKLVKMGDELRCYRKAGKFKHTRYPWKTMKVDEHFQLKEVSTESSARSTVSRMNRLIYPKRFWLEVVDEVDYVVWRQR